MILLLIDAVGDVALGFGENRGAAPRGAAPPRSVAAGPARRSPDGWRRSGRLCRPDGSIRADSPETPLPAIATHRRCRHPSDARQGADQIRQLAHAAGQARADLVFEHVLPPACTPPRRRSSARRRPAPSCRRRSSSSARPALRAAADSATAAPSPVSGRRWYSSRKYSSDAPEQAGGQATDEGDHHRLPRQPGEVAQLRRTERVGNDARRHDDQADLERVSEHLAMIERRLLRSERVAGLATGSRSAESDGRSGAHIVNGTANASPSQAKQKSAHSR